MSLDYAPVAIADRRRTTAALTRRGLSAAQISTILGVSERTVVRYRAAEDVRQGTVGTPLTAEEFATAQRLLDDGCSREEVARSIGRSHLTITKYFPGRCWTAEQVYGHLSAIMRFRHAAKAVSA